MQFCNNQIKGSLSKILAYMLKIQLNVSLLDWLIDWLISIFLLFKKTSYYHTISVTYNLYNITDFSWSTTSYLSIVWPPVCWELGKVSAESQSVFVHISFQDFSFFFKSFVSCNIWTIEAGSSLLMTVQMSGKNTEEKTMNGEGGEFLLIA